MNNLPSSFMFEQPIPSSKLGCWVGFVNGFSDVVGYSALGDFFLRNPSTGQYAALFTTDPELVALDFWDPEVFSKNYLGHPVVQEKVLKVEKVTLIASKLGPLTPGSVYIPTPFPFLGGDESPESYTLGDVWTFVDVIGQMQGVESVE